MKKHSQEKTHQCQYCSRKFYRHDKLLEHQTLCEFDKEDDQGIKRKFPGEDSEDQTKKQPRIDNLAASNTTMVTIIMTQVKT